MIIILLTLFWMIGAIITCGILIHCDPEEYGYEPWITMAICAVSWPLMGIFYLVYLVFFNLGKLATAVSGFLDSFRKEEEDG